MLSWSCLLLKPWLWLCICKRFPRFEPLGSPRLKIVFPLCTLTSVIFFRRIIYTDGRNLADRIMECGFRACYKLPNCAQSESQVFHRWKVIQSWLSSHFPSGKNCQLSCFGLKQDIRLILSFFFSCHFFAQLSNLMFLFRWKTTVQSKEMMGLSKGQNIHLGMWEKSF